MVTRHTIDALSMTHFVLQIDYRVDPRGSYILSQLDWMTQGRWISQFGWERPSRYSLLAIHCQDKIRMPLRKHFATHTMSISAFLPSSIWVPTPPCWTIQTSTSTTTTTTGWRHCDVDRFHGCARTHELHVKKIWLIWYVVPIEDFWHTGDPF